MSTERQNVSVKHWRIKEDKGGWWWLGYDEGGPGMFNIRGRIFGLFLAQDICDGLVALESAGAGRRPTHGRHCRCTPCGREDWTNPKLAPCGMHGPDCPNVYDPYPEVV